MPEPYEAADWLKAMSGGDVLFLQFHKAKNF
jgi:hypothetical protein